MMITVAKIDDRLTGWAKPRTVSMPWLDFIDTD
jgi:hypothetical protein